ncbi:Pleckstrin y domain-containing family G member 3 [Merluccius polli]|uniref:Pleckstrin y domain-containing family G member 3 n=1 Tax=Merluccius polli TaxID=89951 RepID=A0AA47M5G7_MERPO|nr:Pleckstrin y domain-containing family G member 3 [Merluccius polli]
MGQQKHMCAVCGGKDRWGEVRTKGTRDGGKCGVVVCPGLDVITIRRLGFRTKHRLGQWLGGLSQYFMVRYFKHAQEGLDSPRLSAASIGSTERAPSATPSDGSDPPSANQRPLSLVSTLSSGSASSRDDCQAPPPTGTSSPTPSGEDIDLEPIGEHVRQGRGVERNNNITAARNAFRRHPKAATAGDAMAPSPQLSYVDRVVMEIIETERMYVRDLRMIVEVQFQATYTTCDIKHYNIDFKADYLAHIIDHADLSVGPELVCALFGNIEDIYEFNSELLQSLDQCDNDPVAVARCFVMKSEYFDIYTQYCTNYPNSVAALTECMRNKSLAKFFRERQASLKRSLPLGSYLLKPVQRILKYHLLLQEIAKHSDQQGADYEVVEEAIYTMTGVAWYINDMKRRHEHAVRLQEVQSLLLHWKGPDLTTYGELVLEGTFKVHRAKNERTLFLFDRMLLITKRRGEHYVYKAQISCSTLMLMESAKDSLSFSVTHYKHLKQPHTVQARNLEEKKLWSHHIKRIILENHHAIIPQKAKEAILEMDSIYPSKYRYSPDRLKKGLSVQSEELPPESRQGRRQSDEEEEEDEEDEEDEEGEGAVPGEVGSAPPRPEGEEGSVDRLSCSDDPEEVGQDSDDADADADDMVLLEDYQVADFASSMLAAISCWHSRARALLSLGDATDEEIRSIVQEENHQRLPDAEDPPAELQGSEDQSSPEKSEPTSPKISASPCGPKRPAAEPAAAAEPSTEVENPEEPPPATQDSDSKTLSSEESSEEEESEEAGKETKATSILPSSVLSRAGAIAQHFTGSTRRPSLASASDDACSPSCLSPRLPSRRSSGGERPLRPKGSPCSPDTPEVFRSPADPNALSPREDGEYGGGAPQRRDSTLSKHDQLLIGKIKSYYEVAESQDPAFCLRRRESLTSIPTGLVRSSVSHFNCVPAETPRPAGEGFQRKPSLFSATAAAAADDDDKAPGEPDFGDRGGAMEAAAYQQGGSAVVVGGSVGYSSALATSPVLQEEEEEFRSSSEMIQVWQAMEQDLGRTAVRRRQTPGVQAARSSRTAGSGLAAPNHNPDSGENDLGTITEEASGLSKHAARTDEPAGRTGSLQETLKLWGGEGPVHRPPRVLALRGRSQGPSGRLEKDSQDDPDAAKSKVLSLARQYSQRIKTSKPAVRPQGPDHRLGRGTLSCVLEESESSGKPNLSLLLASCHRPRAAARLSPVESGAPGLDHLTGSRARSPASPTATEGFCWPDVRELRSKYGSSDGRAAHMGQVGRSLSVPAQMTDGGTKRRSSYSSSLLLPAEGGGWCAAPPLGPQLEGEGRSRLHRTKSLDHRLSGLQLSQLEKLPGEVSNGGFRGYYVSAEAPLPTDPSRRVVIVERLPEEPEVETREPAEPVPAEPAGEEEDGENFVQIRSPTSREKISIMAVIDRCKAYQETEEYKLREEAAAKMEAGLGGGRGKEQDKAAASPTESEVPDPGANQHSVVKNLRDKFQKLR